MSEFSQVETEIEALREENLKLTAQLNKAVESSGIMPEYVVDLDKFLKFAARIATGGARAEGFNDAAILVRSAVLHEGNDISLQEAAGLIKTKLDW